MSSEDEEKKRKQYPEKEVYVSITKEHEKMLSEYYYRDGYTFGRDGLFQLVKDKHPDNHPTRRQIANWLGKQKIQQLFTSIDHGGTANRFIPTEPWKNTSIDLIDYTNNSYGRMRYIIVFIDNFSRFMYASPIPNKEATTVAKSFSETLRRQREEYPNAPIKTLLSDDGGEFKGEFEELLERENITKRRILGGHAQQNGMVERANGKLKMILAKNKMIRGGGWGSHLEKCRNIYNEAYNRGIKYSPRVAAAFTTKEQFAEVRKNNEEAYNITADTKAHERELKRILSVGAEVRIRLAKGALSKSSEPSWSSATYRIAKVLPAIQSIAPRYLIEGKDPRYKYSRNDLFPVVAGTQSIPKQFTDEAAKKQAVASAITRSLTKGAFTEIDEFGLRKGDDAEAVAEERRKQSDTEAKRQLDNKKARQKENTQLSDVMLINKYKGKRVQIPLNSDKFSEEDRGDTGVIDKVVRQRYAVYDEKQNKYRLSKSKLLMYHVIWDNGSKEETYKLNNGNAYKKDIIDHIIVSFKPPSITPSGNIIKGKSAPKRRLLTFK